MQKPRYVRVNTLMLSVEKAISSFEETGWKLLPRSTTYSSYLQCLSGLTKPYFIQDLHIPEVLVFPSSTSFHQHPGYHSGELILQDKVKSMTLSILKKISILTNVILVDNKILNQFIKFKKMYSYSFLSTKN